VRLPVGVLRAQARESAPLRDLLDRYTVATLVHANQTSACLWRHSVEQRLVRWLLLGHDRGGDGPLPPPHPFLGPLLGGPRATVTTTTAALQRQGLIQSRYGRIMILDRGRLEAAACGCYAVMRAATEAVFR